MPKYNNSNSVGRRHRSSSVGSTNYDDVDGGGGGGGGGVFTASAGGSGTGTGDNTLSSATTTIIQEDRETSHRLLSSIMYLKDRSGKSFLHTKYQLGWAKALLDRAKSLDDDHEQQHHHQQQRQRHQQHYHHQQQHQNHAHHKSSLPSSSSSLLQRRFLLQQDEESGYTPLHRAILESNLPSILLILRHVTNTDTDSGGSGGGGGGFGTTTTAERFKQRPMSVLHLADSCSSSSSTSKSNNLATLVTSAVDHEGMTPLQLLGMLQRTELQACRDALDSNRPQVDVRFLRRLRPRRHQQQQPGGRRGGGGGDADEVNIDEDNLQVDFFTENGDLLLPAGRRRRSNSNSDDDDDTSDGDSSDDDGEEEDGDKENAYACEVMTFGRGCALGVVSSGSSPSSSTTAVSSYISSQTAGKVSSSTDQPFYNASTFFPQRVNEFAQEVMGRDGSAVMAAAATHHTLVVLRNGHVYSFGVEKGGRLGLGDDQPQQCPLPRRVLGPLNRRHVVYIAAAENHSLCVTKDGCVFAWGSNRFGQLGDTMPTTVGGGGGDRNNCTNTNSRSSPRRVEDLKGHPCVAVAAGDKHSVALTRKGEVYVWGDNSSGQLGVPRRSGTQKVQRVEALWNKHSPKITLAIAASEQSTLALTAPAQGTHLNSIYEWGNGNNVPLRVHFDRSHDGGSSNVSDQQPNSRFGSSRQRIPNPVAIACAKYHNAAIDSEGMVYTWGVSAESLGRSNTNSKTGGKQGHGHQRRNSSPQLVSGMLPEKGGGYAVRIAASGRHTAVITNTGSLYTWGNTESQSVLGHEGIRWQPSPRRVPGVHRAVFVAVAKEHTVLLIGASFPKLSKVVGAPLSLEEYTARKIAAHVDLFNVIPIMVMAERTECNFLITYCNDFIRKNLDAVICVGRRREMNVYLNDILSDTTYRAGRRFRDDHHHPLVFDILSAGNRWRVDDGERQWWSQTIEWTKNCAELAKDPIVQRLVELADIREYEEDRRSGLKAKNRRRTSSCNSDGGDSKQRSRSLSGGGFLEMSPAKPALATDNKESSIQETLDADASTTPLAKQKHSSLSREIRSVRKKLKQIASLESRSVVLTTEEKAKVNRRNALETDLRLYETALEEVDRQIRKLAKEDKAGSRRHEEEKGGKAENAPSSQNVTFADDKEATSKDHGSRALQASPEKEHYFCSLCSVRCSDKSSLLLHQNGRKHRNRSLQLAEEDAKKTAASILEQKQSEELKQKLFPAPPAKKTVIKNAWGALPSATAQVPPFKLPPPPHPIPQSVTPTSMKKTAWKSGGVQTTPSKCSATGACTTHLDTVLATQSKKKLQDPIHSATSAPKRPFQQSKPIWDSSPGSTRCVPLSLYSSNAVEINAVSHRSSVSLADFLTPSKPKAKPGSSQANRTAWSSPQSPGSATPSNSLKAIVAEETDLRNKQDKSYGKGGGSWYVERRQRADSILEIQQAVEKELEYERMVEEQKAIEAQIQEDIRRQREDAKKVDDADCGRHAATGRQKHGGGQNRRAASTKKKASRKSKTGKSHQPSQSTRNDEQNGTKKGTKSN